MFYVLQGSRFAKKCQLGLQVSGADLGVCAARRCGRHWSRTWIWMVWGGGLLSGVQVRGVA